VIKRPDAPTFTRSSWRRCLGLTVGLLLPVSAGTILLPSAAAAADAAPKSKAVGATTRTKAATANVTTTYQLSTTAEPRSEIDRAVFPQLARLAIPPAHPCTDAVFVRRVYLDVIGTLPTAAEARQFLQSQQPNKRDLLIDQLLQRDEFADYWAMKWSDLLRVKAEFPINLWPNAAQAYHQWIRTAVRENRPYDRFARELLTASGSNFRVGPANFYRAVQSREPAAIARTVALTFMGVRAEKWPERQRNGMAAFFAQIGYKASGEWKEELVFFDATKVPAANEARAVFPGGTVITLTPERDPREVFADWLTKPDNPWFARALANRVWAWLLGRGIVHEADDLRPDNPPVNPALLDLLTRELVASGFDVKHLFRLILTSQTYQLASITPAELNATQTQLAEANFAFYPLRRLEAEVLIDALNQITGTTDRYSSAIPEPFTYIPADLRSIALPDGSISSSFLETFGRPARDTGLEAERSSQITANQRLHLLNSTHILRKLEQGPRLQKLFRSGRPPRELIGELYLAILSRPPTAAEMNTVTAYLKTHDARRSSVDLAWALINTAEFLYRH